MPDESRQQHREREERSRELHREREAQRRARGERRRETRPADPHAAPEARRRQPALRLSAQPVARADVVGGGDEQRGERDGVATPGSQQPRERPAHREDHEQVEQPKAPRRPLPRCRARRRAPGRCPGACDRAPACTATRHRARPARRRRRSRCRRCAAGAGSAPRRRRRAMPGCDRTNGPDRTSRLERCGRGRSSVWDPAETRPARGQLARAPEVASRRAATLTRASPARSSSLFLASAAHLVGRRSGSSRLKGRREGVWAPLTLA